jgi:carbon storage regulator CsrA
MLVLSRDCDSVIRIGPDVRVKVLSIRKQRVKLGVDAPANVRVWRDELEPHDEPPAAPRQPAPRDEEQVVRAVQEDFSILVVEDDPDHARLIAKALSDSRFPQVTLAKTGTAAINALTSDDRSLVRLSPQLVLLDLHLPDMSGVDVLRRIRADGRHHTLPVVMLSSDREESSVADCLEAGANAFVNKSAQFKDFRESVSRIAQFWKSDCRILRPGATAT